MEFEEGGTEVMKIIFVNDIESVIMTAGMLR